MTCRDRNLTFELTAVPVHKDNRGMKTEYTDAKILTDAARKTDGRRYRNILANSGKEMESGEVRDLDNLYVMSRGDGLIKISKLATDPDKQTEQYKVSLATNHGHYDPVTGERVVEVEDIIGDARVWMEADGLHARIYFADNDPKADHAYAVSDNASYSIGTEWYEDGYMGAGEVIDGYVGILREISMVDTGNDPRAVTIDTKQSKGVDRAALNSVIDNKKGKRTMSKTLDGLTPEERDAMAQDLAAVLDKYSGTEATENADTKTNDEAEGEKTEAPAATTDSVKHMPVVIVKDHVARQEKATSTKATDYLKSDKAVAAWGKSLLDSKGDARAWRDNFRKIAKKDGVDFGEDVSIVPEAVINAVASQLEDEDSIFSHVNRTGLMFEMVAIPTSEDEALGHVAGKTKTEEEIEGATRTFTPADLYELMRLDHAMVEINGGISSSAIAKYVLSELPRKLIETINKAILVGGVNNDDAEGTTAATKFTALNPILADIKASGSIYGTEYTAKSGDNMRQTISKAANKVTSGSNRFLICPADYFADLENATTSGGQLLFPNGISKSEPRINGISRVITPMWLTSAMLGSYKAIIVDLNAYHTVGNSTPESFSDYDINVNKYVWEAVACIGGGLANKNAVVGIK